MLSRIFSRVAAVACVLCMVFVPCANADMNGVDWSSHQSVTAPCNVAADFGIVKVNQGTYVNPYWKTQASCIVTKGEGIGLYDYASGMNPESEADIFVSLASDYIGRAVLVLDWERYQNAAFGNSDWIRRWVNRVHDRTHVWPMVYTSRAWVYQIPEDVRANCGLWVAQYANNYATGYQAQPWNVGASGEAMIQYTSHGWLDGYSGYLDLNLFLGERWQWERYANPNNGAVRKPTVSHVQATNTAHSSSAGGASCVVVQSGDTLGAIAERTGLKPYTAWHGYRSGNPNLIWPGERVCYGGAVASVSAQSSYRYYRVQPNDTLSTVFGSDWQRVARLNGLSNPNLIYPNQILKY